MPTALNSKGMDSRERADQKQETVGVNSKGIGSQESAEHQQGTAGDTQQGYGKPLEGETAEDRQHSMIRGEWEGRMLEGAKKTGLIWKIIFRYQEKRARFKNPSSQRHLRTGKP